ncbi:hypothetical protein DGMP_02730 [Desulfomarina profundi]|uniref:Uncharacterized protein n=1 Tax=Desulfomarina profundi TaxID=2772557 RepID=A0A8D5FKW7_9BACT|nr:hypothetical protein DGMP_02730 [Desulfomarina profundi]
MTIHPLKNNKKRNQVNSTLYLIRFLNMSSTIAKKNSFFKTIAFLSKLFPYCMHNIFYVERVSFSFSVVHDPDEIQKIPVRTG